MTKPDHLWPARPEYLRRGTPIMYAACEPAVVTFVSGGGGDVRVMVAWDDGMTLDYLSANDIAESVRIDLSDVTARAHAAMAWTVVEDDVVPLVLVREATGGDDMSDGLTDLERTRIVETLYRMRMLDETVTVAEARAALGWAESVVGVANGRP